MAGSNFLWQIVMMVNIRPNEVDLLLLLQKKMKEKEKIARPGQLELLRRNAMGLCESQHA